MKIELKETDAMFVWRVLRMYAETTSWLEDEDKEAIFDIANKFKNK